MSAPAILDRLLAAGITLRAESEALLWHSPERPSDELLEAMKAGKAELLSYLGGGTVSRPACPPQWIDALARIPNAAPASIYPDKWLLLVEASRGFASSWGGVAAALGWSDSDCFGVHPVAPLARYDCMGLAVLSAMLAAQVALVTRDGAKVVTPGRSVLTYTHRDVHAAVPIWGVGR